MPKKLFKVEVTSTIYVIADDEIDASDTAQYHVEDEKDNADYYATVVSKIEDIDDEWKNALPYVYSSKDEDEELTCKQFLERNNAKA